jgi:hypothetical protein
MKALLAALDSDERERHVGLSDVLLQEVSTAALSCVGFSEQQKASLVEDLIAHGHMGFALGHGMNVCLGGSGVFSVPWPFLALTPQAFVNSDLLKVRHIPPPVSQFFANFIAVLHLSHLQGQRGREEHVSLQPESPPRA